MRLFRSLVSYSLLITSISLPLAEASPADFNDLKEKAEKGNYVAQYNLGLAYIDGSDTSVNLVEAYYWLTIAVENGARGKALDLVYVVITPDQLAAGKKRIADYRAAHPPAAQVPIPVAALTESTPTPSISTTAANTPPGGSIVKPIENLPTAGAAAAPTGDAVSLRTTYNQLEARSKQLEKDLATAHNRLTQSATQISSLEEQLTAVRAKANTAEAELADKNRSFEQNSQDQIKALTNADKEIQRIHGVVDKLNQEKADAIKWADLLEAHSKQWEDQLNAARTKASNAEAELARQTQALAAAQALIEDLRKQKTHADDRDVALNQANTALADRDRSLGEATEKLQSASNEIAQLRSQLGELADKHRSLEQNNQDQLKAISNVESELQKSRATVSQLTQEKSTLMSDSSKHTAQEQQIATLTAKLSETEKAFADAQAQVASLDEIKRKLADTQTSLEKAKSSSGDVAKLTKLRDDALRDKERMAEKLRLANEETSHAQSSTGQLTNELVATKAELTNAQTKLADTQASLEKAKSSTGDVAKLTKSRDDALRDKERMAEKLRLANEETSHAQSSTGQLKNELVAMKAELTIAQTKLADTQASLEKAKSSSTGDVAKLTKLRDDALRDKERMAEKLRLANEETSHAQSSTGQLKNELVAMKAELTNAQTKLAEQSKSIASLEGNVYTANQATEAAKSSLTSAQSAATDAAKHDAELSSIKEKFARNEEQLAVVLRSYTQLKAAHEELEGKAGQLDALNNEKEKITAELREANAQNEHSQAAVGQLQQELIVMKTQLTTTQAALATLNSEHSRLQDGRRTPTNPTPSTPAVPAPVRTHTIAAGETLTGISKKYYGTITRWQDVYNANHDVLKNPNSLPVGSELIIP